MKIRKLTVFTMLIAVLSVFVLLGQTAFAVAPVVSDIPDQAIVEGSTFATINLDDYVSDVDNIDAEMTWTSSSNVELTVAITDSVATIIIPNVDWNGVETITFRATDPGLLFDEDVATFTVTAVNDAPVVTDIPAEAKDETDAMVTFTAISLDDYVSDIETADADIIWTYSGNTDLSVSIDVSRIATITAPANWNGSESITFQAMDTGDGASGALSDSDNVTFTINPVNDAPVGMDDTGTTDENTNLTVAAAGVLSNDTDVDAGDTLSVVGIDTRGTIGVVTDNGDGTFGYDPNSMFEYLNVGETTTDWFQYTVSDGTATDTAIVTITINGVNDVPVAGFSGSPTDGIAPLTVVFNDESFDHEDNIDMYEWDFGDGSTSSLERPTHVYTVSGLYSVSLTVTDGPLATGTETKVDYVNVRGAPVIVVDRTSIEYEIDAADEGVGVPSATSFTLTNNNASEWDPAKLNYDISVEKITTTTSDWLICSTSGSLQGGESASISVQFDTGGLVPNIYEAYIVISDPNASNGPVKIFVSVGIVGEIDTQVTGNNDDAEEEYDGDIRLGDSALDFGSNTVGIRFSGIFIPVGSEIRSAYIEFDAYDYRDSATSLNIYGQYDGSAPQFSKFNQNDISERIKTDEFVSWSPGAWIKDNLYQTPDLKDIIQDIINHPNWSSGNAMAFIVEGSGHRTAISCDGSYGHWEWIKKKKVWVPGAGAAPRLYIEYLPGAFSIIDVDKTNFDFWIWEGDAADSDSFSIRNAGSGEIRYEITDTNSDTTDWIACSPDSGGPLIQSSTPDTITVNYDTAGLTAEDPYTDYMGTITIEDAEAFNSPVEIGVDLRVMENKPVIEVDKIYIGVTSYEGFNAFAKSFILSNTGRDVLNYDITDDADAEGVDWLSCASAIGSLAIDGSSSISINFDTASLDTGTYEATITIHDGNAVTEYVHITVSLTVEAIPLSTACGDVPVYTENLVSPAIMLLLDTSGSMDWDITVGEEETYQTPDISSIVQEIVNKSDWSSGNDMAFIFEGSGQRSAYAYDGSSSKAPLLHVELNNGDTFDIRVNTSYSDAEESNISYGGWWPINVGDMFRTDNDLDLGGDYDVGIRFRNVGIPQGATISNAYIEFTTSESANDPTNLTIYGEDVADADEYNSADYDISNRDKTTAYVSWTVLEWVGPTQQPRIEVAQAALDELVTDKTISWGFGTWDGSNYDSNYTTIEVGCTYNDTEHLAYLQAAIASAEPGGATPLTPALNAGLDYFKGERADEQYGETFTVVDCQPTFVIVITDGMGNTGTTLTNVGTSTEALAAFGVNTVGIGFGLAPEDTEQLYKLAEVSNEKGDDYNDDDLYALHEVVDGVPQPFLAQSKEDLVDALGSITSSIKAKVFHGSAPAPTTSVDYGDIVITAKFQPADWSGDVTATQYNNKTGELENVIWEASQQMPDTIKAFTVMSESTDVIEYTDSTLDYDIYLCPNKDLGDIIDSTPIIVEKPSYSYDFDNYAKNFQYVVDRDPIVYIGANDGALHAFRLADILNEDRDIIAHGGEEVWRFYPTAVHDNLNKALTEDHWNMCDEDTYCHRYFVDGSPVVADIFDDTKWKTMLVCGLREGGEAYFALDITSGKPFDDASDPSEFMWQFTDSELGQTWADPSIDRVNRNGGGTAWAVFFGSGYKEDQTDQSSKEAYLYGIEADNMDPLWRSSGGSSINRIKTSSTTLENDALSPSIVADFEGDYIGEFIYTGNLYGSLYRVKNIGRDMVPEVTMLYDSENNSNHSNPIRAKADYGYAIYVNEIWVYFGTGRYETQVDKYSTPQQYFFGLKDSTSGDITYIKSDLVSLTAGYMEDEETDDTFRVVTGTNESQESWVIGLDNTTEGLIGSERVISQPLVVAGIVFFTTFIPDIDVCAGSGDAYLFAVDMQTGLPPSEPIFDINYDGVINEDDVIHVGDDTYIPAGIPLGAGQPSEPVLHKDTMFVTTTGKGLVVEKVNLEARLSRVTSWKED